MYNLVVFILVFIIGAIAGYKIDTDSPWISVYGICMNLMGVLIGIVLYKLIISA
jgi:hypothetical protein